MAKIAIVHPNLMNRGGAESVSMNIIEAVEDHHDLTLISISQPDIEFLNQYFQTDASLDNFDTPGEASMLVSKLSEEVGELSELGRFGLLDSALLSRYVHKEGDNYDLIISTKNIIQHPRVQCINYVHFPEYFKNKVDDMNSKSSLSSYFQYFCRRLARVSSQGANHLYITNSEYTRGCLNDVINCRTETINPPIIFRDGPSKSNRQDGFVTIGRIEPEKNIISIINIIEQVREQGNDIHLHIVGQEYNRKYSNKVKHYQQKRNFVHLEGEVSRSRLDNLLSNHKYGIHGRKYEHYGMSVAEMVQNGMIPFVPNNGGQAEIVGGLTDLVFETEEEAANKIESLINSREKEITITRKLKSRKNINIQSEFQDKIRELIEDNLAPRS
jgi:glycosyltransferase involved in cell wall biosynthesis